MTETYGIMAEFDTPAATMAAAEKVRDAGYTRWDVHTPFPVHGMDEAMGMGNSQVGWFTFAGGLTGYTIGMLMIYFMNEYDYDIVVGGKPLFSGFYAFPVSYELTILLGAFGSLFGMFILNRLPRHHHPLLKNKRFAKVTHDKFYVVIECDDPEYKEAAARKLLGGAGAAHIELVED
ncbi:MAG: DUF3341 domain-containing protein [Verrucomicrobiota bacterium]|nr:DUF3341 domain-containing protein [Verrucomicrobiota bacterium]